MRNTLVTAIWLLTAPMAYAQSVVSDSYPSAPYTAILEKDVGGILKPCFKQVTHSLTKPRVSLRNFLSQHLAYDFIGGTFGSTPASRRKILNEAVKQLSQIDPNVVIFTKADPVGNIHGIYRVSSQSEQSQTKRFTIEVMVLSCKILDITTDGISLADTIRNNPG